jgi:Mg/Co/Ni transporter MgtE
MGRHLIHAFAVDDPDRFAQLLGATHDIDAAIELLNRMPDGLEGEVLAHLTPEAADRLLNGLPDDLLAVWLGTCSVEAARRLLLKVGPERTASLISKITDRSKRRGLRRITSYPEDTLGSHLQTGMITVPESATAAETEEALHAQQGDPDCPVVVIARDGSVAGILDLVAFVRNQDDQARVAEFCIPVQPAYADAPISSVTEREDWSRLASLPVVDTQDQLVGFVTRSALERATGTFRPGHAFLESSFEISLRFIQFLSYSMELIIGRRRDH